MAPTATTPTFTPAPVPVSNGKAGRSTQHPLDPPTAEEIGASTAVTKKHFIEQEGIKAFKFCTVFLREPPKAAVIEAVQFPGGAASQSSEPVQRQTELHAIDVLTGALYEVIVTLPPSVDQAQVTRCTKLPEGVQPGITPEELCLAEEKVREDPRCVEAAAKVGVKPEEIFADGWSIGWDQRFPGRRLQQAILYARFHGEHSNIYAAPLDFCPLLDSNTGEVLCIDYTSHRLKDAKTSTLGTTAFPTEATFDAPEGRERIPPPRDAQEWLPGKITLPDGTTPIPVRTDLKPLSVVQPEGVSFTRKGHVLEWQNWKMHVGFHPREGMVLSTVSYKDKEAEGATPGNPVERSLFYRMSLSEMVVPYGSPDWPHPRKFALDVGEYGLGYLCNSLDLGCDCLGAIDYMDGHIVAHDGTPKTIKNAICIHEEDAGTGWKHTDYRVGGKSAVVRNRKLIISSVYTVSNYEYRVAWEFGLDGTIGCEIGLTGILNLSLLAKGEKATYGTEVAPQITAHMHQHLFSVRLDPHIDGPLNSVVEQQIEVSPHATGSAENWAGNAWDAVSRVLPTTGEAVRDTAAEVERTWAFVNEDKKHYASGKPAGYKLMAPNQPKLYAKPDSICARRVPFATHAIWTVPYEEQQLYPAGKYPVQTTDAPADSLTGWVGDGTKNIRNADVVSYVTVGVTHIVRPEDFPVMPTEHCSFKLKPSNFFRRSPMLDLPPVKDPRSVAVPATQEGEITDGCCGGGSR